MPTGQGGARARSGPLPDVNALRAGASWTTLPLRREGAAPDWPAHCGLLDGDTALKWAELWTMPQAMMWEAARQYDEVAMFAVTYVKAILTVRADLLTAARQQADILGLSQSGMARLRWRIAAADAAPEAKRTSGSRSTTAARSRFKSLPGGAA